MTQPRSPSAGTPVIAALVIGTIIAIVVDAVLTVGTNYLFEWFGYSLYLSRTVGAVVAVIIGGVVGGATLVARPAGPVVPVLAAVLAFAANFIGDLLGVIAYAMMRGGPALELAESYVKSYSRIDMPGVLLLLLSLAVAAGLPALRHLRRSSGTRRADGAFGAPYRGQFQPPPSGPGFQQPGAHQPGPHQPGPYQPGPYQPGPYQPGPHQPGVQPPAHGQPGGQAPPPPMSPPEGQVPPPPMSPPGTPPA